MSAKIFCRVISTSSSIWFVDGSDVIERFVDKSEIFFGICSRFGTFVNIDIFVKRPFFGISKFVGSIMGVEINDKLVGKGGDVIIACDVIEELGSLGREIFDMIDFLAEFV